MISSSKETSKVYRAVSVNYSKPSITIQRIFKKISIAGRKESVITIVPLSLKLDKNTACGLQYEP